MISKKVVLAGLTDKEKLGSLQEVSSPPSTSPGKPPQTPQTPKRCILRVEPDRKEHSLHPDGILRNWRFGILHQEKERIQLSFLRRRDLALVHSDFHRPRVHPRQEDFAPRHQDVEHIPDQEQHSEARRLRNL